MNRSLQVLHKIIPSTEQLQNQEEPILPSGHYAIKHAARAWHDLEGEKEPSTHVHVDANYNDAMDFSLGKNCSRKMELRNPKWICYPETITTAKCSRTFTDADKEIPVVRLFFLHTQTPA